MEAPTGRVRRQTSNRISEREKKRYGCRAVPHFTRNRGLFFHFHQHRGKIRRCAILAGSNKNFSAEISRARHLMALFGARARRTMFCRTEWCTRRCTQYRQQGQHCKKDASWSMRSNWIFPVHAYSLTLPRCTYFVNNALLFSFKACSFLEDFARHRVGKRPRPATNWKAKIFQ